MTMNNHAPTPWKIRGDTWLDAVGALVPLRENMEFLLTAVNTHDQLLNAAKGILATFDSGVDYMEDGCPSPRFVDDIERLRAAIAQTKKGQPWML